MSEKSQIDGAVNRARMRRRPLLWVSGAIVLPFVWLTFWLVPTLAQHHIFVWGFAVLLAPLPALLFALRQRRTLVDQIAQADESAAQLQLQLDAVRYRTSRLREDLQAADRQARLSHQLSLLGQFTAGFMHEFNNPLAIVAGRLEVLLDERKADAELCSDLEQMLNETRYMGNIARTLLQALRRERGSEVFEPSAPEHSLGEAIAALMPTAVAQQTELIKELTDVPRIDLPEHVVSEVVRGLLSNALAVLKDREDGKIWVRLDPYRTAGARVIVRVEDNGPGVPEQIREHLFEPFVSQSAGRERLGLGLFLAASLLDMYDGRIRYETRAGGGASFILELPPTRYTRGQPYHWFTGGNLE